jgi:predicted GIY-YIG superfamily endonuclease
MVYWVYILECADGSYYTGIAKNIEKRLAVHETGKGSRYVASHLPFRLVYRQAVEGKSAALKRELEIKQMTHKQKARLIYEAGLLQNLC